MTETTLTKTIIINATPEEVFECLRDPDKAGQWMEGISNVSEIMIDDEGNSYRNVYLKSEKFRQSVEIEDVNAFTVRYDDNYANVVDKFSLNLVIDPDSGETPRHVTELRRNIEYDYYGWHRVVAPFIREAVWRRLRAEMTALRNLAEGRFPHERG